MPSSIMQINYSMVVELIQSTHRGKFVASNDMSLFSVSAKSDKESFFVHVVLQINWYV